VPLTAPSQVRVVGATGQLLISQTADTAKRKTLLLIFDGETSMTLLVQEVPLQLAASEVKKPLIAVVGVHAAPSHW
jgi:hypothetical protein